MRRFTPLHLRIVMLNWQGRTNSEIAQIVNRSDAFISTTLAMPEVQDIIRRWESGMVDTTRQVQTMLQMSAPLALEKKIQLLNSSNPSVANKAAQDLLELSGHVALRQIEIRRPDHVEEEFRDKSEEDIKREILAAITGEESKKNDEATPPTTTVH